jgi:hypothetical protein
LSSKFLPSIGLNALYDGADLFPVILGGTANLRETLRFCKSLRRRAICDLLALGSAARLHLYLHKSGRAFLQFLQRASDDDKVTSRADPFFDAISALDLDCARDQSRASRHTWNATLEYEDDFLYVRFLMARFFLDAPPVDLQAILARYEAVVDGAPDPRLSVCKAFLIGDAEQFDAGLTELLDAREAQLKKLHGRGGTSDEEMATEGKISIEGLALTRLADLLGLATRTDYLFVPSLARSTPRQTFSASDDWLDIVE